MNEFYIIRHGQTDYNKNRIVQGSGIDSDLNELGRMQALQFYNFYKNIKFDFIITSALKRSWQTVEPFILEHHVPFKKTHLINEISWGVHEGRSGNLQMKEDYDNMIREWSMGNYDARLEQAESAQELITRCSKFVDMLRTISYQRVLICTHGRTLRCLMCIMKGQNMHEMENYDHHNTGLFLARYADYKFEFIKENDISHRV